MGPARVGWHEEREASAGQGRLGGGVGSSLGQAGQAVQRGEEHIPQQVQLSQVVLL